MNDNFTQSDDNINRGNTYPQSDQYEYPPKVNLNGNRTQEPRYSDPTYSNTTAYSNQSCADNAAGNMQPRQFNYRTAYRPQQVNMPNQVPPQTGFGQPSFRYPAQNGFNNSYAQPPQYMPPYPNTAPPVYGYYPYTPREAERNDIRKAASISGKITLAIEISMFVLTIVVMIIAVCCGVVKNTAEGDPYMGFTPMGFYFFEGLISLVSISVPTLILLKSAGSRIDSLVPFKSINGKPLTAMVVGGVAVCMLAQVVPTLLGINLSLFGIDIYANMSSSESAVSVMDFIMEAVCTALIPALVEEFAYRGLVIGVLKKHGDMFAVVTSAILFGMLHGNFVQIPFAFVVGLVLGYVRVKTDSMLPSVLIHFCNNFFAVSVNTLSEIFPENVSYILETIIVVLILIAGFIAFSYLSKKHKNFFEYKTNKEQKTLYTYKEKLQIFFSNGFIIADMIILSLSSIIMLIPTDEIMTNIK